MYVTMLLGGSISPSTGLLMVKHQHFAEASAFGGKLGSGSGSAGNTCCRTRGGNHLRLNIFRVHRHVHSSGAVAWRVACWNIFATEPGPRVTP